MRVLNLDIQPQPDDTTCGPTCLHAVYQFYDDRMDLHDVIAGVPSLRDGGTLAVLLACHALQRGYRATIYTYNLQVFDPSWFTPTPQDLPAKLRAQARVKSSERLTTTTDGYLEFLRLGGLVSFEPLTRGLVLRLLRLGRPILTGLSATYLYQEPREVPATNKPDDVAGLPAGHFVVLCGHDEVTHELMLADPLHPNPLSASHFYQMHVDLVLGAILLGVVTYDANLLILEPPLSASGPAEERP